MVGFAHLSLNLTAVSSSFGLTLPVTDIEKSLKTGLQCLISTFCRASSLIWF